MPTLEAERFARVTAVDRWASRRARNAWTALRGGDLQRAFLAGVLPSLLETLQLAQTVAADIGVGYVAAVAGDAAPVRPQAFSGVASDGRSLRDLLSQPLIGTFEALSSGVASRQALNAGRVELDRIVVTQVHDAAREAEQVATVATRTLTGYVRSVEPGACGRCVILAGRYYGPLEGFLRHPKCRCSHQPTTREVEPQDPRLMFDQMSPEDQDRAFTMSGAQAIRDGADPARVVNARRGMSTATVGGRTVSATAALAKRGRVRLMPQSIYELADGDRTEAVRLLRVHRYIT